MAESTSVWTIFCDDVRAEVGNKVSYMGIYGPNLLVEGFPTSILKLCLAIYVRSPIAKPPKDVSVKIFQDESVIAEQEIQVPNFEKIPEGSIPDGATYLSFTVVSQLANFPVAARSVIKVRAVVDGEEIKGGQLWIDKLPEMH